MNIYNNGCRKIVRITFAEKHAGRYIHLVSALQGIGDLQVKQVAKEKYRFVGGKAVATL